MTAAGGDGAQPLVAIRDLSVIFPVEGGVVRAVDGVGYDIAPRRTLGVVGESGSGKSVAALAMLRLVAPPGRIASGSIRLGDLDLLTLDEEDMRRVRGGRIAMIFQEPMTALNPVFAVGEQIAEVLRLHRGLGSRAALDGAVALLERVGIPAPRARARDYPHQLSGGMRQRAMIAEALAGRPELLIADEPTTALDVTIQAQILDLMLELQDELGMAVQFISHNLAVVSEVADDIMVMYAGRIVERAPAAALIGRPLHPYTQGLIAAVPRLAAREGTGTATTQRAIPGTVPDPLALPPGCRFSDRCPLADDGCRAAEPELIDVGGDRQVACFKARP